jgi:hypothetical protein
LKISVWGGYFASINANNGLTAAENIIEKK